LKKFSFSSGETLVCFAHLTVICEELLLFVSGQTIQINNGRHFCPTDGEERQQKAKFEILDDYRPEFIDRFEQFLRENNVQVAGIEVIQGSDGRPYTYDVNTNTNYDSDAEAVAQRFGMLEMAKYLGRELAAL
jgi:hypothetical protein